MKSTYVAETSSSSQANTIKTHGSVSCSLACANGVSILSGTIKSLMRIRNLIIRTV